MKNGIGFGVAACLSAAFLVYSGLDWQWAKYSEYAVVLQYIGIPSVFMGILVPVAMPVYFYANPSTDAALVKTSSKAFLVALSCSTLIKAFTNRIPQEPFTSLGLVDFSQQFRIGFLQGETLWESLIEGFPSGHTMTAFAMSVALLPLIQNQNLRRAAILYALYMGFGVSVTVHWLSDAVAGGLIGVAIGKLIARNVS